jgi:hypothetical protein
MGRYSSENRSFFLDNVDQLLANLFQAMSPVFRHRILQALLRYKELLCEAQFSYF